MRYLLILIFQLCSSAFPGAQTIAEPRNSGFYYRFSHLYEGMSEMTFFTIYELPELLPESICTYEVYRGDHYGSKYLKRVSYRGQWKIKPGVREQDLEIQLDLITLVNEQINIDSSFVEIFGTSSTLKTFLLNLQKGACLTHQPGFISDACFKSITPEQTKTLRGSFNGLEQRPLKLKVFPQLLPGN